MALHHHSQDTIDARLVLPAVRLEPSQHVRVQADRQLLLYRRPRRRRLFQERFVESRNVGIVDFRVFHPLDSCQVAFYRFLAHAGFLHA